MKALVLAAGVGQRLRPLTETIPKPLLEVGGRPLIHYPLLMLKRAGIRRIAINTHHLARAMESALGSGAGLGIEIVWAPEPVLLGTGGPLNALSGFLRDDAFVIARPDNLEYYSRIEVDPEARVRRMRLLKSRAPRDYDDIPPEPPRDSRLESFMYCGAMIFEPQVLDLIPASPPWSLMTGLVGPMVREGLPVFGYPYRGLMRTIDDLDSYHRVHAEFETAPPRLSYLNRVV